MRRFVSFFFYFFLTCSKIRFFWLASDPHSISFQWHSSFTVKIIFFLLLLLLLLLLLVLLLLLLLLTALFPEYSTNYSSYLRNLFPAGRRICLPDWKNLIPCSAAARPQRHRSATADARAPSVSWATRCRCHPIDIARRRSKYSNAMGNDDHFSSGSQRRR